MQISPGLSLKLREKKTALSITMSLIAGRYSQNLIVAEWSHQLVPPKRGSYNQNEILFGVQMVNSWIKACRTSRLVSCQAWNKSFIVLAV